MTYVDGFMAPIKPGRKDDYIAFNQLTAALFLEHGALRVVEGWNDDVNPGKVNDMRTAVLAQEGQDVVFSWIEWPDRATRDAGWQKLMRDERMKMPDDNPMIGAHMIFGGFDIILDEKA
jgi:uncharacterized protein YbaA (DUF1428 family)